MGGFRVAHVHAFHTFVCTVLTFWLGHVHALTVSHKLVNHIGKQVWFHVGEIFHLVVFARRGQFFERSHVRQIVEEWIREIVYGLTSLIHVMNPSCIILGGGVMEQEYVLKKIRDLLDIHLMESYRKTTVKRALLGNCAGMYGAAAHLIENGSF